MKDYLIIIVLWLGITIPVAGLLYVGNVIACNDKGASFEDVEYRFFAGCMVKHKGRWLPLENIRGFD